MNNGNDNNNDDEIQDASRMRYLLLFLRHVSKCTAGECTIAQCTQMKELWGHITYCTDANCDFENCVSSRSALTHYRRCRGQRPINLCSICTPIKNSVTTPGLVDQVIMIMSGKPGRSSNPHTDNSPGQENVTLAFSYQSERALGLSIRDGELQQNDIQPVSLFCRRVHASAKVLFSQDNIMNNDYIDSVLDFGRKSFTRDMVDVEKINDDYVKAVLLGRLRVGDTIKTLHYTTYEGEDQWINTDRETPSHEEIRDLVWWPDCYPITLTVERSSSDEAIEEERYDPLSSTTMLNLSDCVLARDTGWNDLSNRLSKFQSLTEVDLSGNDIERNGCIALAPLLAANSSLTSFSLKDNLINDDCVEILANSLKKNRVLKKLDLDGNEGITDTGWESMLGLVCSETSMESLYLSNYTLHFLGNYVNTAVEEDTIVFVLKAALGVNGSQSRDFGSPRQWKMWLCYFKTVPDQFDLQPILDLDAKLMPHVMTWFTEKDTPAVTLRLNKLYHLLRNWDIPTLFGFPSAEKLRIRELESFVARVKAERDAAVNKLQAENLELRKENNLLKGGETQESSVKDNSKRMRTS